MPDAAISWPFGGFPRQGFALPRNDSPFLEKRKSFDGCSGICYNT